MAPTLCDVLRAVVRGDASKLNDPTWVDEAVAVIDAVEAGAVPAVPGEVPSLPLEAPAEAGPVLTTQGEVN